MNSHRSTLTRFAMQIHFTTETLWTDEFFGSEFR
jgi:hypothetical protein